MLKKHYRLVKEKDFKEVFKKGRYIKGDFINLKFSKNALQLSQFGFVVSTKVSKKAVIRNKIKRRLKRIIQINLDKIKKGYDVVVITQPATCQKNYKEIEDALMGLLKRANIYD